MVSRQKNTVKPTVPVNKVTLIGVKSGDLGTNVKGKVPRRATYTIFIF